MSKLTLFQQSMTVEDMIYCVKLAHPDLDSELVKKAFWDPKKKQMATRCPGPYTWCSFQHKFKGYGYVNICIDNHRNHTLWGPNVTKAQIKRALDAGEIGWRAWRITIDRRYKDFDSDKADTAMAEIVSYVSGIYQLPSVDEFYDYYYED